MPPTSQKPIFADLCKADSTHFPEQNRLRSDVSTGDGAFGIVGVVENEGTADRNACLVHRPFSDNRFRQRTQTARPAVVFKGLASDGGGPLNAL